MGLAVKILLIEGKPIREALLIAGPIRLCPILMTGFAIIFGMMPLAVGCRQYMNGPKHCRQGGQGKASF